MEQRRAENTDHEHLSENRLTVFSGGEERPLSHGKMQDLAERGSLSQRGDPLYLARGVDRHTQPLLAPGYDSHWVNRG